MTEKIKLVRLVNEAGVTVQTTEPVAANLVGFKTAPSPKSTKNDDGK